MGSRKRKRAADRTCRPPMQSPRRPPGWRREHEQRFWDAVGRGLSSEEAAAVQPEIPVNDGSVTAHGTLLHGFVTVAIHPSRRSMAGAPPHRDLATR